MKKTLLVSIIGMASFFSLVATTLLTFSYLGYRDLMEAKRAFASGELSHVMALTKSAKIKFTISQTALTILTPPMSILFQKEAISDVKLFLQIAQEILDGSESLTQGTLFLKGFTDKIVSGERNRGEIIAYAGLHLKDAKAHFAHALSEIDSMDKGNTFLRNYDTGALNRELVSIVRLLDTTEGIVEALPKIFPEIGERTYLILFQNNMEIRPTGGFIGSFALLTFDNGKMDFAIHDVYDADGQLKGHVEPPMPIRKYIPQVNWFLRDSNWNPDFQKSGEQAAWFLEKEIGVSVDGIVAADVGLLQILVKDLGEVYLSDYGETITHENIFLKTEAYVQKDSFPGSRQKKNFLGALARSIIDKVSKKPEDVLPVLRALNKASEEKRLLFAFFDPFVQQHFSANKWDGALSDKRDKGKQAVHDFLAIREANLGVNKVNLNVLRNIMQDITVGSSDEITGKVTITYDNQNPESYYKNYLRVYLPNNASFTKLMIDGKEVETVLAEQNPLVYEKKDFTKKIAGRLEVEETKEGAFSMIGFLIEVSPQTHKSVSITYKLPSLPSNESVVKYDLLISKQPGTEADPYVLTINHPASFTVRTGDPSSIMQPGKLTIPSDLSRDRQFNIEFVKK